ncbi:TetR/AcrR family transcriptional regulator [Streptomyces rapamycinicus]|uniref:HTH tetR-type domain-containing protein n=2 Tax=Streptomyces rapamycinicus TaxID=1226757 RepID=A0A0A0NSN2_STRRN|nr:TetR/AcrR family transcriptional regulator [Streptomyces rapamycinicus]AGP60224.1 hypothetical protein M271_44280 [Streptomyces rapamycinicus NRRL 5491]MBB4788613.1 AcrR family transcriptional regulator [Streptomyces rapamycinicus]RLV72944.1 hypothetical protein D3C57_150495 [Streptomyces rapamycinicus NRRL 5491]UTP35807.1 TetR/AcrR family transcriptional regulator [Streptomyces rapamycinicus NRRL 5491]
MTMTKPPSAQRTRTAGRRRAADTSARRQDIIDIAADLFATRGYRSTTVREIGDAAGVLSGSLYHHFDSKETILHELVSGYLKEIGDRYQEISDRSLEPAEAIRQLITAAFSSLHAHRAAVTVIQNEREQLSELPRFAYLDEEERRTQRLWVSVLQEGISSGVFRAGLDPDTVYRFIRDAVWVSVRWYRPEGPLTEEALADQYLSVILHGLLDSDTERVPEKPKRAPAKRTSTAKAKKTTATKKTTTATRTRTSRADG